MYNGAIQSFVRQPYQLLAINMERLFEGPTGDAGIMLKPWEDSDAVKSMGLYCA